MRYRLGITILATGLAAGMGLAQEYGGFERPEWLD